MGRAPGWLLQVSDNSEHCSNSSELWLGWILPDAVTPQGIPNSVGSLHLAHRKSCALGAHCYFPSFWSSQNWVLSAATQLMPRKWIPPLMALVAAEEGCREEEGRRWSGLLLMPSDALHSTEGGDKRRGSCPVVRMARAAVEPEPKRPWAVRDDQAVTQKAAETVSQKGKRTLVSGWRGWYWEFDLTLGNHQGYLACH